MVEQDPDTSGGRLPAKVQTRFGTRVVRVHRGPTLPQRERLSFQFRKHAHSPTGIRGWLAQMERQRPDWIPMALGVVAEHARVWDPDLLHRILRSHSTLPILSQRADLPIQILERIAAVQMVTSGTHGDHQRRLNVLGVDMSAFEPDMWLLHDECARDAATALLLSRGLLSAHRTEIRDLLNSVRSVYLAPTPTPYAPRRERLRALHILSAVRDLAPDARQLVKRAAALERAPLVCDDSMPISSEECAIVANVLAFGPAMSDCDASPDTTAQIALAFLDSLPQNLRIALPVGAVLPYAVFDLPPLRDAVLAIMGDAA